MKEFCRKLVVILVESELNRIKGKPIYYQPSNEENVSNSKFMIVDDRRPILVHTMPIDPCKLVDVQTQHVDSRCQIFRVSDMLKKYEMIICTSMISCFFTFTSHTRMGAELQTVSYRFES
jgi:hypothetical protein